MLKFSLAAAWFGRALLLSLLIGASKADADANLEETQLKQAMELCLEEQHEEAFRIFSAVREPLPGRMFVQKVFHLLWTKSDEKLETSTSRTNNLFCPCIGRMLQDSSSYLPAMVLLQAWCIVFLSFLNDDR
jgi:hypothetical protein